jgi:hypothetical protein
MSTDAASFASIRPLDRRPSGASLADAVVLLLKHDVRVAQVVPRTVPVSTDLDRTTVDPIASGRVSLNLT